MDSLPLDETSFILGMVTAFCECVAADCKPLALSPPMTDAVYDAVHARAESLISAHGLLWHHEPNAELPAAERCHWLLIFAREETLAAYLALRAEGHNPRRGLAPFAALLGYGGRRFGTGYDAYRALFQGAAETPCT